jgi:membrane fusion protein, copper/silver efflux system
MTTTNKLLIVAVVAVSLFFLGRKSGDWGSSQPEDSAGAASAESTDAAVATLWTCPMHPQIKLPDAGDCPICGMDLVPMTATGDDHPRQFSMSPAAKELARIEVAPVVRKNLTRPVRMVGKIDFDETLVRTISAWVAGRLDRLFVDYTGVSVRAGDHLVWLYSPELLTAQEELLSAKDRLKATQGEASVFLADSNRRAYTSARDKLILWGLTPEQVDEIEIRGTAEDHMMITSPSSGVITAKLLDQGAYVKTGTPIYRIADLTRLWVRLDAYEQDLGWLRYGQTVVLEVEALPGESFEGRVSFIDPVIHDHTRTAKVRVIVDNQDGRLKPGMFVRAVAMSRIGGGGRVLDPGLAGKWVGPMHPEIVKDGPGQCEVCGMDLLRAEELGMAPEVPSITERPLVVPSSALLITGKRAVVYVEVPGQDRPTYEGREVSIGPRAGDQYLVLSGLAEGERVVVSGAFRIDSDMQIQAKPSMLSMPAEGVGLSGPEALLFRASLTPIYEAYFTLHSALAGDDFDAARAALGGLRDAFKGPVAISIPSAQRTTWSEERSLALSALEGAAGAESLEALRSAFGDLSTAVLSIAREFSHDGDADFYEVFCPMAFDNRGAAWLQTSETVRNPYFGAAMSGCGDIRAEYPPSSAQPSDGPSGQADREGNGDGAAAAQDDPHAGHNVSSADDTKNAVAGTATRPEPAGQEQAAVYRSYLALQVALATDDPAAARSRATELAESVKQAHHGAQPRSTEVLARMAATLEALDATATIDRLRSDFRSLSVDLLALEALGGNPLGETLKLVHCPMAFDFEGADWVQSGDVVKNPYFGAEMQSCGSVKRNLEQN